MMVSSQEEIPNIVKWFNLLGWCGLVIVLMYNAAIFVLFLVDCLWFWALGDHLKQMDDIRKHYYWAKVKKYEDEN